LQDRTTEITKLEKDILTIHQEVRLLIYERSDINETLSERALARVAELDERCDKLQKQLRVLRKIVIAEKDTFTHISLKPVENKIMKLIVDKYPNHITVKELSIKSEMKRNRVYECIRPFIVAGFIEQVSTKNMRAGYILSLRGKNRWEEDQKKALEIHK
jgi:23S rRNA G2069 N7-methylase RlmK/C1962 C5-methylase RlmI